MHDIFHFFGHFYPKRLTVMQVNTSNKVSMGIQAFKDNLKPHL